MGRSARLLLLGAILGRCARRWRGLLTRPQRHAERRGLLPQVAGSVPRGLRGCAGRRLDRPIRAAPGPAQPDGPRCHRMPLGPVRGSEPVGQRRTRGGSRRTNTTGRRGRPADLQPAEPIRWAPMMSRLGRRKHVAVMSRLRRDARWLIPLNPPKNAAAPPSYFSAVLTARPTVTPLVGYFSAVLTARPTVTPLVGYFSAFSPPVQRCRLFFGRFDRAPNGALPRPGRRFGSFLAKAQMPPLAFPAPCSVGAAVPGVLPVRPALTSAGAARPPVCLRPPRHLPCCAAPGRFVPPGRSRLCWALLRPQPCPHPGPQSAVPARRRPSTTRPARPARRRPSTTRPPEAQHDPPSTDPPSTTRPPEAQHDPPAGGPARPARPEAQHDPPSTDPPSTDPPSTTRPPGSGPAAG